MFQVKGNNQDKESPWIAGAFLTGEFAAWWRISPFCSFRQVSTGILCAIVVYGVVAPAQTASVPPKAETHCTLLRDEVYQCNRDAFIRRLQHAHTVRIDADRMDLYAAGEMGRMAPSLGLTVISGEQRPDLIFDLAPVDHSGRIDFGPNDISLATLSVYDPAKGSGRRGLIWVETYIGQQDRPWPSVVTGLLQQLHEHALPH